MKNTIKGKVYVLGNDIDTDQIIPAKFLSYDPTLPEEKKYFGKYALYGVPTGQKGLPEGNTPFIQNDEFSSEYKIIIAGKNFGCGSSREQAPVALKEAGVGLVIAESFARIFRRNAINIGIPVLEADLRGQFKDGETISVDIAKGLIFKDNITFYAAPLSRNVLATLEAGGLIERVRRELGVEKRW